MKIYYLDDYGAVSDGTSDCTEIWNKIVSDIGNNSAVIEFGSGKYWFKSSIEQKLKNSQSITIKGQGKGVTILLWDGGDSSGLKLSHIDEGLNECRYNIYDMSFITTDSNKETAIEIRNKSPEMWGGYLSMRGIKISGQYSGNFGNQSWATCLFMEGISFNNIIDCDFVGNFKQDGDGYSNGVVINCIGTIVSIVTNFTDCNFLFLTVAVTNGDGTQGLSVSQCNFNNNLYGIVAKNGYQVSVTCSQFDNYAASLSLESTPCFLFQNNLVFVRHANGSALIAINSDGCIITGNQFEGLSTNLNGIVAQGVSMETLDTNIIVNNIFRNLSKGIWLGDNTKGWEVSGNRYANCSDKVLNQSQNNIIKDS